MNDFLKALAEKPVYDLNEYAVAVFGAGATSVLYQKCFAGENIHPVCYVDNNPAKQNTMFYGVPVVSAGRLAEIAECAGKPLLVMINSANIDLCDQIKKQLDDCGLTYLTVDEYVFAANKERITEAADLLEDDFSRETYLELIRSRVLNIPVPEYIISGNQYFVLPQFRMRSEKEVFVDCGAYAGDTVEQYLNEKSGFFGEIYAFEPDRRNFAALSFRAERLKKEWAVSDNKLTLINAGVGEKTQDVVVTANCGGLGANLVYGNISEAAEIIKVPVHALDDYFKETPVGFIKADIESYEPAMLRGAEKIINRDRPLLSVCVYHNATDMYEVPLLIKQLRNDYKLKIRHHSPMFAETIVYAY